MFSGGNNKFIIYVWIFFVFKGLQENLIVFLQMVKSIIISLRSLVDKIEGISSFCYKYVQFILYKFMWYLEKD